MPELSEIKAKVPQPSAAVVSTDSTFITFMKLRLEYVVEGQFDAPTDSIPNPLAETDWRIRISLFPEDDGENNDFKHKIPIII